MFTLTCKADYALLALSGLANWNEEVSAREIAERLNLPLAMLRNILKDLASAGLLQSSQGARGGYGLSRSPEAITVAEVLEAIEGPFRLTRCCSQDHPCEELECPREDTCMIRDGVNLLQDRLRSVLAEVSLAELVAHASSGNGSAGAPTFNALS